MNNRIIIPLLNIIIFLGLLLTCNADAAKKNEYRAPFENGVDTLYYKRVSKKGQIKSIITVKNYMKNGLQARYAGQSELGPDNLFEESHYKDNVLHGSYKWKENGYLRLQSYYVSGKLHGLWIENGKTGYPIKKGYYEHGEKTGLWLKWNSLGKMTRKSEYENGICLQELQIDWTSGSAVKKVKKTSNGKSMVLEVKPAQRFRYSYFGELPDILNNEPIYMPIESGTFKMYHKKSGTLIEESVVNNSLKDGKAIYLTNSGLKIEAFYLKGVLNGKYIIWNDDGKLKKTGQYLNGEKHGEWKNFRSTGKLLAVKHYKDGKLHGKEILYNNNGTINVECTYRVGKLHGQKIRYSGGHKKYVSHFINGKKVENKYDEK